MNTLRQRIEQRITDLRAERDIAAAATPGPWDVNGDTARIDAIGPESMTIYDEGGHGWEDATHIATQDPATVIARIDRELAGCAADLALLDRCDYLAASGDTGGVAMALANLNARYPGGDS